VNGFSTLLRKRLDDRTRYIEHRKRRLANSRETHQRGTQAIAPGRRILFDEALRRERDEQAARRRLIESGQSRHIDEADLGRRSVEMIEQR
jgi:hypothetical protein